MPPKDQFAAFAHAFGDAVREARQRIGLSQEGLGFEAEMDRTYVSGIERGVRNPTLKSIARLARALGVRVSVLVRRAEDQAGIKP